MLSAPASIAPITVAALAPELAAPGWSRFSLNAPKRIRVASDGVGVVVALSFLQGFGSRWLVRVVSVHADAVGQDPGAWRLGSWRTAVR
jgi:hypothetical protein